MSVRAFDLGDILSITTGKLVSNRHMEGVYDILDFMTNSAGLFTHQLPRARQACAPALLTQHPELSDIQCPEKFTGKTHVEQWLQEQVMRYGKSLMVAPLAPGTFQHVDPREELCDLVGPDKVLVHDPNDPERTLDEIRRLLQ